MAADGGAELPTRAVVITVAVERPEDAPGVVAGLLDHLDRRRVPSTWFVPADVDPGLVDRLFFTGHEVAAAVPAVPDIRAAVDALNARDVGLTGVRVTGSPPTPVSVADMVEQTAGTGLSYVCVPPGLLDGEPELPLVRPELTVLATPAGPSMTPHPLAWLQATQVAVGRVLEHGGCHELRTDVADLDRPDALGTVAEAVDLISGLARAERLWLNRLDRYVAALTAARSG